MTEISELLKNGESEKVEFKKSSAQLERGLKAVCAFSNHSGGSVYFGIHGGKVIGQEVSDSTLRSISQKIRQNIKPEISPKITVLGTGREKVIEVKVKEGLNKPYYLNGIAYKRVGAENPVIPPEEIERIILERRKDFWDERICPDAGPEDIDVEKLRWFLKEAKYARGLDIPENTPVDEALMRLKLMKDKKPTNAAVLLFGKEPDKFFTRPEVKCIRFKGTGVTGKMIDFKLITGDLFGQLIESEKFIYNNIKLAAWIEKGKLQRQEKWEYPSDAIREALANALCHREYETTSGVQVRIFDDRMEFWNPGRLPEGWTVETLKQKHESKPSNPLLLKHFFWVKFVEDVGTGTNKLIDWCKDWELPEPDFEFTGTSIVITFRKSRLTEEFLSPLNERQRKMVEYLKLHEKITKQEYMNLTGISKTHAFRDINNLLENDIIRMEGSGRSVHYVLKESVPKGPKKDLKRTEGKYIAS